MADDPDPDPDARAQADARTANKQARRQAKRDARAASKHRARSPDAAGKGSSSRAGPAADAPRPRAGSRPEFFEQAADYAPLLGVATHAGVFLVPTSDNHIGRSLFTKQERPETRVLQRAIAAIEILLGADAVAGRVFIDVGANIGTTTVAALVAHGFGSAVSLEPEPGNYRLLAANAVLNGLGDRVRALPVAASNRAGRSDLVVDAQSGGLSWIAIDRSRLEQAQAEHAEAAAADPELDLARWSVVDVELVTLDGLARDGTLRPDDVGLLWIDAESHEGHILLGAGELTSRAVPIVVEFHPTGLDERGDRATLHRVAEQCYTHFVDVRRPDASNVRFRLRPVGELHDVASRFLDPSLPGHFTDVLLVKLDEAQARIGSELPQRMKSSSKVRRAPA